jgi:hypothetical protein
MKSTACAIFAATMLVSALLSGCGGGNGATVPGNRRYQSLVLALTTPKTTYARGEPLPLTFEVRNVGLQAQTFTIGGCDFFDTRVTQGSRAVWQRSLSGGCGGSVATVEILPGDTKSYSYTWEQVDQQDVPVPPGHYTVKSWFQGLRAGDANFAPGNQEANEYAEARTITVQ